MADGYIERVHLESRLESGVNQPLTIVSAPAGYGKSSLLSRWLEICDLPGAWLSLDESDSDLLVFLHYVVAAIRTKAPDGCNETLALLRGDSLPPVKDIAIYLGNDLHRLEKRMLLVLDDYHRISEPDIHQLLDFLLRHPPRNLHLVVASRHDPPFSLARLRARHLLNEFRMRDLEFSSNETTIFVRQSLKEKIDQNVIRQLQKNVEGWPVAVRLATLALQTQGDAEGLLSRFGADTRPLQQYLIAEVLAGLPEVIRKQLLLTSILTRFNASLCEAVWGSDLSAGQRDGKEFIHALQKLGLFCTPLDGKHNWYRYHHLFSDLLNQQLQEIHDSDAINQLHDRASRWLVEHGYPEEAIQHALAACDQEGAASIVGSARHELMNQEKWNQLERWLRLFPEDVVEMQPQLLILRCWLNLYYRYQLDLLAGDVACVTRLITNAPHKGAETDILIAEATSLRSAMAFWTLDPVGTIDMSRTVLTMTPPEHQCVQDNSIMMRVGGHQMLGEMPKAERLLWEYMEKERSRTPGSLCRLIQSQCFVYWCNGDTRKLFQSTTRLEQVSRKHDQAWSLSFVHYFFGLLHYEQDELDEAIQQLEVIFADPYRYPIQNVTHCALLLSLCYQAKGLPDQAVEIASSIARLTLERGNRMFVDLVRAFQAEIDLRQGRIAKALKWAHEFEKENLPPHAMHRFFNAELTLIRIYMVHGNAHDQKISEDLLNSLHKTLVQVHQNRLMIDVLGMKAIMADLNGNEDAAIESLQTAIRLAQPGRLVRPFVDLGPSLIKLLNRLKLEGEGLQFVGAVIAAMQGSGDTMAQMGKQDLLEPLSDREIGVLELFAENLTNKEIGEKLFISPGTVKRHAHNIYGKLAVGSRRDAVTKALGLGLIQP